MEEDPLIFCKQCGEVSKMPICEKCYRKFFSGDEKNVSHAFEKDLNEFIPSNDVEVLDLTCSGIKRIDWKNLDNLKKLRISNCKGLTSVSLLNCRALKVIDISYCENLKELKLESTYNVKVLDLTECVNFENLDCDLLGCEYLSIASTKVSELSYWPLLKYLDISGTPISDISFLTSFTELQVLILNKLENIEEIDIGALSHLRNLASIESDIKNIDFKDMSKETRLHSLYLKNSKKVSNFPSNILRNYNGITNEQTYGRCFKVPLSSGDWIHTYRQMFGPFAPPPNDIKPLFDVKKVVDLPAGIDPTLACNQICGVIFGSAIGDCTGSGIETCDSKEVNFRLEVPLDITWSYPKKSIPRRYFEYRGAFTDDTALSMTFMQTMCHGNGVFDPVDAGKRIKNWILHGIDVHLDERGVGSGSTTRKSVSLQGFDEDPIKATEGMITDGNGGIMRTGAVGCYKFWDIPTVVDNATKFCKITHNTSVCVYSSVLISVLVAKYISLRCGFIKSVDIDETIAECFKYVELSDEEKELVLHYTDASSLDELNLLGFENRTLQTMGAAIYALRKGYRYAEGVETIIRAGGDTDTNAAVAGAVLGARWGFDSIPIDLIHYFWFGGILMRDLKPFLGLMGLEFKQKEWFEYPGISFPDEEDTISSPFAYQKFEDIE